MALTGWFMGMVYHLSSIVIASTYGDANVSLGMGWFFTSQVVGGVLAPPGLGAWTDHSGTYATAFQFVAVCVTLATILMGRFAYLALCGDEGEDSDLEASPGKTTMVVA